MPRSSDAKEWQPDALGQEMIDRMANFIIVAERCAAQLRSFNFPSIERLWAQVQADFQGDPVKYPAVMADYNDVESRKQFQMKCEAICFPPKSRPPRSPEDYIRIIFAAHAGLQSITSQDLLTHLHRGEIDYRANLQVLRALEGQAGYDVAVEFDDNLHDKPIDLLHETIRCRDKTSGKTVEYTVVDFVTSMVSGDEYFVLQSREGQKKQVTAQEFYEMRID